MKRVLSAAKRYCLRIFDYGIVAIRNPKLFIAAARHVINRRQREFVGELNASLDKRLLGPDQINPVSADALVEGLSDFVGVIHLGTDDNNTIIGVADVNFITALLFLRQNSYDSRVVINQRRVSITATNFKKTAQKAGSVEVTFLNPSLDREFISLEAYSRRTSGNWVSNNLANAQLRALYDDRLISPGMWDVADILDGVTLDQKTNNLTVDAVYTWVNHNDPKWAAIYAKYSGTVASSTDADALSRFHSNDELRYSLRSVAQNAPWINRIFILTNCARPNWLAADDPQLVWVDHTEVIPADCLPTFNSHVIESCIHRIPKLSEHFLYLNDDVFLAKPLKKSFFFDEAGTSHSFLEPYGMVSGHVVAGAPDYLNAARNVAGLLRADMGFVPTRLHKHTAFALRKSILAEMETRWQDVFDALRRNRFRTASDINITSFFYHHYAMAIGKARLGTTQNAFVKSLDVRWRDKLKDANKPKYDMICINEGGSDLPAADWHSTVRDSLADRFSKEASWEVAPSASNR